MNSVLIKDVLLDKQRKDVFIENGKFSEIGEGIETTRAENVIDGKGKALLPALYNTHTHAAMTLLRGYADDMELNKWLTGYIWPYEENLTADDIRKGSKIAVREMVSTGSVFFNDMYFNIEETIDAVAESGMRAAIGITVMDNHSLAQTEEKKHFIKDFKDPTGGRIQLVMAPHSIYCVSEDRLVKCTRFARENGMRISIHLSETQKEVDECIKAHGMTPVEYLDKKGILGPDVIAAHCVKVNKKDADILAERGVTIAHCPCSNMKLSSGRMPYEILAEAGCRISLATDGASSNNNLDLREEMKIAALLAKLGGNPELLPAEEVFKWASINGAQAFGIDAGIIGEGKLADCLLVNLDNVKMQPCHNLLSNFVYSADSSCISSVICDGRIIYGH